MDRPTRPRIEDSGEADAWTGSPFRMRECVTIWPKQRRRFRQAWQGGRFPCVRERNWVRVRTAGFAEIAPGFGMNRG